MNSEAKLTHAQKRLLRWMREQLSNECDGWVDSYPGQSRVMRVLVNQGFAEVHTVALQSEYRAIKTTEYVEQTVNENELTEEEDKWARTLNRILNRRGASLSVYIDLESDGEILITSESEFDKKALRWLNGLRKHLADLSLSEDTWLLANIDGWHIGKGRPKVYSYTTVGPYGAMGGHYDTFSKQYVECFDVDEIGNFGHLTDEVGDYEYLAASIGAIDIEHINGYPPSIEVEHEEQ